MAYIEGKGQIATTLCPQWTTTVPMPSELLKLEALSIQHAKYHQTWYILCKSDHLQFSLHSTKFSKLHLLSAKHCTMVHVFTSLLKLDQPLPTHYHSYVDCFLSNQPVLIVEVTYIIFKNAWRCVKKLQKLFNEVGMAVPKSM